MVERSVGRRWARGLGITVLVLIGLVVLAVAGPYLVLLEQTTPDDGDRFAENRGAQVATVIAETIEPRYADPLDAENLAQRAIEATEDDVVALAWEGDSGTPQGATVDVMIRVEVDAWSSGAIFGDSRTAGSSTSCWRFTVRAHEYDATASRDEIGCPDEAARASSPDPTPLPSLDPGAEAAVLAVLDGLPDGAGPAEVEAALRREFREFVDVRAEREDTELVASVGVLRSRDCVVGVRPDGEAAWRFSDFRRVQLEPGEGGCDPGLYLRPVSTH